VRRSLAASLVACPDCDLLQQLPSLAPGETARCTRCGAVLWRRPADSPAATLALVLAVGILLLIANTVPMLGLSIAGNTTLTTVIGGVLEMWREGRQETALLVLFAAVLAPALEVVLVLVVLFAVRQPPAPHWVGACLRAYERIREWSMIEIMLLGVLVALIKIAELAAVIPGLALFVLGALVFLRAAMAAAFDPRAAWERIVWATDVALPAAVPPEGEQCVRHR